MQGKDYETSKWYIVTSLSILGLVVHKERSNTILVTPTLFNQHIDPSSGYVGIIVNLLNGIGID